jgi:hypothetical protein
LEAVQDLGVRAKTPTTMRSCAGEEIVLADEDTAMRVESVKAITAIFSRDPQSNQQDLARRLRNLLKNDREEVCQQVANALAELGPDGKDALEALWARLGTTSQPTIRDSVARAILMIESNSADDQRPEGENPLLAKAFDKLASPDPEARRAGVMFLTTNVGWGLLMRSENKDKVQNLLRSFRMVSARDLLLNIVNLIVDVTPGYAELFRLFDIHIPPVIFEPEKLATTEQSIPSPVSFIVPWKKAIVLVDPRVRNFVNERILKRQVRLALANSSKWFDFDARSDLGISPVNNSTSDDLDKTLKQRARLGAGEQVKIIDRSPHSNWWQIERQDGSTGWVEATAPLEIRIDGSGRN